MRLAVLGEGGLLIVAMAAGRWLETPPFARFRWDPGDLAWGVAATVPLLLALRWCLRTSWEPLARLVAVVEEHLVPLFAGATLPQLALLALAAGTAEEALFRGVLQEALTGWLPAWAAVAGTSLLFGMVHWVSRTYAVLAALVGAYLGIWYLVSGNLLVPIAAHALYDLVALSLLPRRRLGGDRAGLD